VRQPTQRGRGVEENLCPTTAELVILCAFGRRPKDAMSAAALRKALTVAGFRAGEARHLIRTSPLLESRPFGNFSLGASPGES
jgi:hypothetical protein